MDKGLTFNMNASSSFRRMKYGTCLKIIYTPASWNDNLLRNEINENIDEPNLREMRFELGLKFSYIFNDNKL